MFKNKSIILAIIIILLLASPILYSGCIFENDDITTGAAQNVTITREGGAFGFFNGSWLVEKTCDHLLGIGIDKAMEPLMTSIFGENPTDEKLNEILDRMQVIDHKLDLVVEQLGAVQTQITNLSTQINAAFLDLETYMKQDFGSDKITGIETLWKIYTDELMISVDVSHTSQEVLLHCTSSVFLQFAYKVVPDQGTPQTEMYVQGINDMLLSGGLSTSNTGLLKLWTDNAIVAYSKSAKTPDDLINCYNYIDSNFQNALLWEGKGALMIVTALQAIEQVRPDLLETAASYRSEYKKMLKAQAVEFRNQVERFVVTSANIKTSANANFLPDGHFTVFERTDYLYRQLAGQTDADGLPAYGLCGRVIAPFDLSAGGTAVTAGSLGTLSVSESATYNAETVSQAVIVPQKIDSWQTEFRDKINEPISTFTLEDKWYVYRYYIDVPSDGSASGTPYLKKVDLDLVNGIKSNVPVVVNGATIKSYDESTFTALTAAASGSRLVNFGNFTITAGFAGNSVFFALPAASAKPYIWYSFLTRDADNVNSIVNFQYADCNGNVPRFGSSCSSVPNPAITQSKCHLVTALQKIIRYGGSAPLTAHLHFNITASGTTTYQSGVFGEYDDFTGFNILESAAPDSFPAAALLQNVVYHNRTMNGAYGPQQRFDFSQTLTNDSSITFQPGKYYRINLHADVLGTSGIYSYPSDPISYSIRAEGKLNEFYFNF